MSSGSGQHMFVGRINRGSLRRALVAFDLTGLPSGAQVTAASLQCNVSKAQLGPQVLKLRRVTTDWGEGASDAEQPGGQGAEASVGATWPTQPVRARSSMPQVVVMSGSPHPHSSLTCRTGCHGRRRTSAGLSWAMKWISRWPNVLTVARSKTSPSGRILTVSLACTSVAPRSAR